MIDIQYIRTSTLLLDWDGMNILTDPWFAMHMRGLPVFVRPCIRPKDLPALDLILVSHLHPDHFDRRALSRLVHPCKLMVGPPGTDAMGGNLPCERIAILVEGQVIKQAGFTVRAFSVQHSGYENAYLVERNGMSLFFAGDAKYTDVFMQIGKDHSPLVSLLPVGGTEILGRRIVMNPRDALRAAGDLGTKIVIPIHKGGEWMSVPPLSRHPGRARELVELAESTMAPLSVVDLLPGQRVLVDPDGNTSRPSGSSGRSRA